MITPAYSPTATERVLPRMALDFTTGVLDSRVTIARALNTATRVNSSGLVEIVNANLPRFDYDPSTLAAKGLLIEEARTNSLTYSQEFNNVIWLQNNVLVTQNTATAPDGTLTADLVSEVAVPTSHLWTQSISYTSGVSYTFSVYMKKGSGATAPDWMQLTFGSAAFGASQYANFNLATGAVGTVLGGTATIQNAGSGWYRLSFTATATATATTPAALAFINNTNASARLPTYTGATTSDVLVWGAQVEAGAFATSYIPTTTTSLTRNPDLVSMTGTNFSDWFNASEGTFAFEGAVYVDQGATTVDFLQASNSVSNAISIDLAMFGAAFPFFSVANTTTQANLGLGTLTLNTVFKMVGAYKLNSFVGSKDGGTVQTDNSGTIPSGIIQLGIGNRLSGPYMNGWARKIAYWPQRLINAETQSFSKLG
jgi:hypothetical protein